MPDFSADLAAGLPGGKGHRHRPGPPFPRGRRPRSGPVVRCGGGRSRGPGGDGGGGVAAVLRRDAGGRHGDHGRGGTGLPLARHAHTLGRLLLWARGAWWSRVHCSRAPTSCRPSGCAGSPFEALGELFERVDMVATPTASTGATHYDQTWPAVCLRSDRCSSCVPTPYWDSVGNPALVVPMGFTAEGLPLSLQLAGRHFDETTLLTAPGTATSRPPTGIARCRHWWRTSWRHDRTSGGPPFFFFFFFFFFFLYSSLLNISTTRKETDHHHRPTDFHRRGNRARHAGRCGDPGNRRGRSSPLSRTTPGSEALVEMLHAVPEAQV